MLMKSKARMAYMAVLLLLLYACANVLQTDEAALDNRAIAQAYTEIDELIDNIDALSQPRSQSGHWPLLNLLDKARLGAQVRNAKALIDAAHEQLQDGATDSNDYIEARTILDALHEEILPLLHERQVTSHHITSHDIAL